MAEQPRKLSELPDIVAEEISGDDLLLVSDNNASGGCVSKKMTMAQIVKYIGDMLVSHGFYVGNQTLSGILSSTCQPKGNYLSSNALSGNTYDMNENGAFTGMVIDVVQALGGTVINSPFQQNN